MDTTRNFKEMEYPFFTIIIPTYARPARLKTCLRALSQLCYPSDRFEVIVIDDGSPERLDGVVAPFHPKLNLRLITQQRSGPAKARNTGAVHANGEFLAFADDDCAPDPGWLQALANRFAAGPDHMIGGQTLNAIPRNLCSTATHQLISYLYDYHNNNLGHSGLFVSNNLAVPTGHFLRVGGFDTTFTLAGGEDRQFCRRWLHHGYRMTYAPEAVVYHTHDLTPRSFYLQHFNYGMGAYRFHRAKLRRGSGRILPEPLSFYLNLLYYPFSHTQTWPALLISALLVVSQVANAMGYFWGKFLHNRKSLRPETLSLKKA